MKSHGTHTDTRAWTGLSCLPKLVLRRDLGGATCVRTVARWCWRDPLAEPTPSHSRPPLLTRKRDPEPHDLHLTPKATRTISNTTLEKEGQLSKDCSAFLKEPLGPNSETVAEEMRDGHPRPRAADVAKKKVLSVAPVSLATTPSFSLVQEALLSFDPDSAAGPSGFRPRHQGRAQAAKRGRHHGRGPHPRSIVSWIASASLAWH